VVGDLDTDASGLGPEGQLDGAVDGRGRVGVLGAVARGLVHSQQVVLGVPGRASGASQRRTSARGAARLRGYDGQLRRTNSDRSAGRSRLLVRSCRPPGARVRGSATNRASWVQGNVLPAISKQALKKLSKTVRSWRLHRCISKESADLARMVNPVVRGWMNYYGCFYRSALHPLFDRINTYLLRWIQKKYRAG
jgi:hypothetical protein